MYSRINALRALELQAAEPGKSYSAQAGVLRQSYVWGGASAKTKASFEVPILVVGERTKTEVAEKTGLSAVNASCATMKAVAVGRRPVAMIALVMKNSAASAGERKTEETEWAGPIALNVFLAKRTAAAARGRPKGMTVPAMMNSAANAAERKTTPGRRTSGVESALVTRRTTSSTVGRPVAANTVITRRIRAATAVGRRTTTSTLGRPAAASTLAPQRTIAIAVGRPVATSAKPAK